MLLKLYTFVVLVDVLLNLCLLKENSSIYIGVSHNDKIWNGRGDQISSGEGKNFSVFCVEQCNGEVSDRLTTCDEVPRERLSSLGMQLDENDLLFFIQNKTTIISS